MQSIYCSNFVVGQRLCELECVFKRITLGSLRRWGWRWVAGHRSEVLHRIPFTLSGGAVPGALRAESSSWPEGEINPPDEGAYADKQHLEELRAEGQPQELFSAQKV
jgi:hypothetical protein